MIISVIFLYAIDFVMEFYSSYVINLQIRHFNLQFSNSIP